MITAEKAREKSIAVFEKEHEETLEEFNEKIEKAIQEGKFLVKIWTDLRDGYLDYLLAKGYKAVYENNEYIISWT